ncbi:MAG TPA: hypothetical protein VEB63_00450 [Chitinophagaceae bacterium]|nr:hypothetical protein [Chitinophagaceae bacterium]
MAFLSPDPRMKFILLLPILSLMVTARAQKGKGRQKKQNNAPTEYIQVGEEPKPDSSTKFTGIVKYRITTDDPSDLDSMFVVFGDNQIAITMFYPGVREGEVIKEHSIARFSDSSFIKLDTRNRTYRRQKLWEPNAGTLIELMNTRKTAQVLKLACTEYSGSMTLKSGEVFDAACLLSRQHSFLGAREFNFMNIQPVVSDYRIVLGYRTRSPEQETTLIMAYRIEPGNVEKYFDLSSFREQ